MAKEKKLFSTETIVALIIPVMLAAAGMIVSNPYHSAGLVTLASFAAAIVIVRQPFSIAKKTGSVLIFLAIAWIVTYDIFYDKLEKDLRLSYGHLVAGNAKVGNPCEFPHKQLTVYVGSIAETATHFPYAVIKVGDENALIIDKDENGNLSIASLTLRDASGNEVVTISKNNFEIHNGYEFFHPDGSFQTLGVKNPKGDAIFYLDLKNEDNLILRGDFRSDGNKKILVKLNTVEIYLDSGQAKLQMERFGSGCFVGEAFSTEQFGKFGGPGSSLRADRIEMNP